MVRKIKRKYTRKAERPQDALVGGSSPVKGVNSVELPLKALRMPYKGDVDIIIGGVTARVSVVTEADIAMLPPSLKHMLQAETRRRKILRLPDNLKERTEQMVKRFI